MTVYWPGLIAVVLLYVAVFAVGAWAGKQSKGDSAEELLLAGRSLPLWIGLLTMTATWVGGAYINGTASLTYSAGALYGAQAGLGYAVSLVLGGLFFARTMRKAGYTTLVDPLEQRYGRGAAAVLMLPAVLAELFWSAAVLVALGTTFAVVLGIEDRTLAILVSSAVAVGYTVLGGLRAVAYTDVIQMFLILGGLLVAIPFAVSAAGGFGALDPGSFALVDPAGTPAVALLGLEVPFSRAAVSYADFFILLALGGIPWNVYFQRVLSARDENAAAGLSIAAGFACALMMVPPLVLGLAAQQIDWSVALQGSGLDPEAFVAAMQRDATEVLPNLMRYAIPQWVGVIGLGAVSAAVMSSVDSSILSGASLVAWNGVRQLIDPTLDGDRMARLVRILIVVLGAAATVIALTVGNIGALWYLCGDIVYCVLFPQLTLALFDPRSNRTGALAGLAISLLLRLGGGEATLGLPAFLPWPDWGVDTPFPFRTVAMLGGLLTAVIVSRLTGAADPPRPRP